MVDHGDRCACSSVIGLMCVCMHMCAWVPTCVRVCVHVCANMYVHACRYVSACMPICVCMRLCACMLVCVCVYTGGQQLSHCICRAVFLPVPGWHSDSASLDSQLSLEIPASTSQTLELQVCCLAGPMFLGITWKS